MRYILTTAVQVETPSYAKTVLVLTLLFGSASSLCAQTAQKDVSIVLDDWWTIDYVKNGCEMQERLIKDGNPHISSTQRLVQQVCKIVKGVGGKMK